MGGKRTLLGYIGTMDTKPTMLQFDWEEVEGATVEAVVAKDARAMDDGSLRCETLGLILGAKAVVIRVNDDTDELIVSREDAGACADWPPLLQLGEVVSRDLGWCWVGRNYRGYLDTFTLAFDGIDPGYSFTGVGSCLQCARVVPIAV